MHFQRSFALFVFSGLLLFAPAGAHSQNTASSAPAIRASSSLVLVDVVVTDHDKPVLGLDRSRFHVFEDGSEQALFSFDEHQPADAPPAFLASAALPPNTYTNLPAYPESSAVNVLLLDALNTPLGDQTRVRNKMIDYLGTVKPGTTMAIFTLGTQLRIVTQFTSDPAALVRLLNAPKASQKPSPLVETPSSTALDNNQVNAVAGSEPATPPSISNAGASSGGSQTSVGPINAVAALQQFQADQKAAMTGSRLQITLNALMQLANYLAGIPGRKNVIWFSGAFPMVLLPGPSGFDAFANVESFQQEVQKTSDRLTAARVAIYPVDASGLWEPSEFSAADNPTIPSDVHAATEAQTSQWSQEREQHYGNQATMQAVADETGGKAYLETNDFGKAVAGAIENGSSYYTLAYAPKNTALDGRYRKIQVSLDGDHSFKLAYRRGYYADAPGGSSPAGNGPDGAFPAALSHDAPQATAILLKARVLPAGDPAFQGVTLPAAAAQEKSASFKGPAHPYIVDLTIDAHGLVLDNLNDGSRKAAIELAMIAYDGLGHPLNSYTHAFQVGLNAAQLQRILSSGITVRLPFDLPAGEVDLRIGVHDLIADRSGSLEVPLDVPGN